MSASANSLNVPSGLCLYGLLFVYFTVPLQESAGNEALAAVRALIRPLTRVIAQMQDQRRPLHEAFTALRAYMRPFARVRSFVNA